EEVVELNYAINGIISDLEIVKLVSEPANIWLLKFDDSILGHDMVLRAMYKTKHVKLAQNNHYVQERVTIPNDPSFSSQWHHVDASDNDIDSDLAWDITTGGLTANGDTIVVCVIEGGGADWDHPDL